MSNLTPTQLTTYAFIVAYLRDAGVVPTMATIGKKFGISPQAAYYRFKGLIDRGYIKAAPNLQQGYETLK